jgi:hypothetical protein
MASDLTIAKLYDFIIGDFEDAWNALAASNQASCRGNFLFARQAMTLLELVCRLCESDNTGQALRDLSAELAGRDSRYFSLLPGSCWTPTNQPEFHLPSQGPNPEAQLIAALFDLIRNGQAHQYQQIKARLTDGRDFLFSLTGAEYGLSLGQSLARARPPEHLRAREDASGDLYVKVCTDVLFIDIREAINAAGLLGRGLTFTYLLRPRTPGSPNYQFSSVALEASLRTGGHF